MQQENNDFVTKIADLIDSFAVMFELSNLTIKTIENMSCKKIWSFRNQNEKMFFSIIADFNNCKTYTTIYEKNLKFIVENEKEFNDFAYYVANGWHRIEKGERAIQFETKTLDDFEKLLQILIKRIFALNHNNI